MYLCSFQSRQPSQPGPSSRPGVDDSIFRCRRCTAHFANPQDLSLNGMQEHYQRGTGALLYHPWEDGQAHWEVEGEDRLKNVYTAIVPIILGNQQESSQTTLP